MAERNGLAITALALGILGLVTFGGLGVGSLVGLALAGAALTRVPPRAGRDVAWAALSANLFALLTLFPLAAAYWVYRQSPQAFFSDDDSLPEPVQKPLANVEAGPTLRLPPLPPARSKDAPAPATRPGARSPKTVGLSGEGAAPVAPMPVGGEIQEPRKTRHVNPVYPKEALVARVQGAVVLECTISPQGKIVAVKTLRSVPLLDAAAIAAVEQWEYTPTLLNGVAVPVIMTVTVNFRLN
jgi:TonB family protein